MQVDLQLHFEKMRVSDPCCVLCVRSLAALQSRLSHLLRQPSTWHRGSGAFLTGNSQVSLTTAYSNLGITFQGQFDLPAQISEFYLNAPQPFSVCWQLLRLHFMLGDFLELLPVQKFQLLQPTLDTSPQDLIVHLYMSFRVNLLRQLYPPLTPGRQPSLLCLHCLNLGLRLRTCELS